jgi:hypothetical protein
MEAGTDSMAFPPSLSVQEATLDPSVVGFLSTEEPTTGEVSGLDVPQLREENSNILGSLGFYLHPVEGRFVGVEGDEGGG